MAWEMDGEAGFGEGAGDIDLAAVALGDLAGNVEPQADAAGAIAAGFIRARAADERIEDPGDLGGGNRLAAVAETSVAICLV